MINDIGYALRVLRKSPGFTAAAALSLALGIGANTAVFTLLDALMWRTLPVKNPETLWLVGDGFTYQQYRAMREQNQVADLAAYSPARLSVSLDGSTEPTAEGQLVSGTYFSLLGVSASAGRAIGVEDDRVPNGHPVAMISHGYWKRRFGLARSTIGSTITLSGTPFTIIGVTPPEFFGVEVGRAPDIFVPLMMQPAVMPASENLLDRPILYSTWLRMLGRLRPGVHPTQAAAALEIMWREEMPAPKGGRQVNPPRLTLTPAATGLSSLRRQFSQTLFILMALVGVVLLIACANTANLLLARAAARRPEFAMRLALGAGRWRLTRQLLVESVMLAMFGGACGILLAAWATRVLVAYMSSGRTPIVLDLNPDIRILAFTAAVSIATGVLFGLAPAMGATRIDLAPALKKAAGAVARSRGGLRPGKVLAVVQVALSLLLVAGAGLFVQSLKNLNSHDAGFERESVLIARVEPRGSDQRNIPGTPARLDRIYRDLIARVETIPGVRSASLAHFAPTSRISFSSPIRLPSGLEMRPSIMMAYPKYFATMGAPIVAGRDFSAGDLAENSAMVALVNETFARAAFGGENAVGKRFLLADRFPVEIIGVAKDSRYANLRGEPGPVVYQPFFQTRTGRGQMTLHVRVGSDSGAIVPRIREELQRVDRSLPVFEIRTLADEVDAVLIRERLIAALSGAFSLLALLLAAVGLCGLLAFGVVQRTGEMGIRMALGAERRHVTWIVMREALTIAAIGAAIGVPAALFAARLASSWISGLLFGLNATDPATIMAAAVVLCAAAALAGYLPARRASRVDPMTALRNE